MWRTLHQFAPIGSSVPSYVAISPDEEKIGVVTCDGWVYLYTIDPFQEYMFQRIHESGINMIKWSADSKTFITCSDDLTIKLFQYEELIPFRTFNGHFSYVTCCDYSSNSLRIVSGSYDESLRIWDTVSGQCLRIISAHADPIASVVFSEDGNFIISGGWDGICRIFETFSGLCMKSFEVSGKPLSSSLFSPNYKYILASCINSELKLVDIETGKCAAVFTGHKNEQYMISTGFVTQGENTEIYATSEDGSIYGWDPKTQTIKWSIQAHKGACLSAHVSKTGSYLLTAGSNLADNDKNVIFWVRNQITE